MIKFTSLIITKIIKRFIYSLAAVDTGNPCPLDEGSPLVQESNGVLYAVGIMSKNKGCGTAAEPTIYTRTMPYYPWFAKVAGDQPTPI